MKLCRKGLHEYEDALRRCKECKKAADKKWKQENRDKVKARRKKWRQENRDRINYIAKKWQKNNPDKVKAYNHSTPSKIGGATIKWMVDKLPRDVSNDIHFYYKAFNSIYYSHTKPTEDDCKILNITMERALELRTEGYAIERRQRRDSENWREPSLNPKGNTAFAQPEDFEKVTNRQKKKSSSFPPE